MTDSRRPSSPPRARGTKGAGVPCRHPQWPTPTPCTYPRPRRPGQPSLVREAHAERPFMTAQIGQPARGAGTGLSPLDKPTPRHVDFPEILCQSGNSIPFRHGAQGGTRRVPRYTLCAVRDGGSGTPEIRERHGLGVKNATPHTFPCRLVRYLCRVYRWGDDACGRLAGPKRKKRNPLAAPPWPSRSPCRATTRWKSFRPPTVPARPCWLSPASAS